MYDDTNTTWRALWTLNNTDGHNYRFSDFPDPSNLSDYINSSDEVLLRLYHPSSGNAAHEVYIDYVALIAKST
jgi:hypothetical protein